MNAKQIVMAVISTVLKVAVAALVVVAVYKAAVMAYDYGYRVFKEEPVAASPGADVTVEITVGKSTLQIGEILETKGLIRDAKLFYIQNLLSHYKDKLQPGVYTLNTSMTMQEMMEVMSPQTTESTEEDDTEQSTGGTAGDTTEETGSSEETGSENDNG